MAGKIFMDLGGRPEHPALPQPPLAGPTMVRTNCIADSRSGLFRDSTVHFGAFARGFATAVAHVNARKSATYFSARAFAMQRSGVHSPPIGHCTIRDSPGCAAGELTPSGMRSLLASSTSAVLRVQSRPQTVDIRGRDA